MSSITLAIILILSGTIACTYAELKLSKSNAMLVAFVSGLTVGIVSGFIK